MKAIRKSFFIVILLLVIILGNACSSTEQTLSVPTASIFASISDSPSPQITPSPAPTPNVEMYVDAYKNYTAGAPLAAVYDTRSKTYYYTTHDVSTRIYPASTTKLFTAYVALQYLDPDEIVIAGNELDFVAEDASVADIPKGSRVSVSTLIKGMMLPSGNDAAYVIACKAGRALAKNQNINADIALEFFMQEVNNQATRLGLLGTHFTTPDGYHRDDHYTTIQDLLRIAELALSNETIANAVQIPEETVWLESVQTTWKNTNWLVRPDKPYYIPDAIGLKTGYTDMAGYVLLSAFPGKIPSSYTIILVAQCKSIESRFQYSMELYQILNNVNQA